MQPRKPRQIARELALLSISQLPVNHKKLMEEELPKLILASVRTLTSEVQETLDNATAGLQRSNAYLLSSQTRAIDINTSRGMLQEAITYTQTAINQLGAAVEFPELIQLANQDKEVGRYAVEIIRAIIEQRTTIDEMIASALVDWQVNRLAQIDRDILRISVFEMMFLDIPS